MSFARVIAAYNFIISWDYKSVDELKGAIETVRDGDSAIFRSYLPQALRSLAYVNDLPVNNGPSIEMPGAETERVLAIDQTGSCLTGTLQELCVKYSNNFLRAKAATKLAGNPNFPKISNPKSGESPRTTG